MSDLHEWERIADTEDVPYRPPGMSDMTAAWRCKKCEWIISRLTDLVGSPPADLKLYRKLPGQSEEWYNCDGIIAFKIMDS